MPANSNWMLIRKNDYDRAQVADQLLRRLLVRRDDDMAVKVDKRVTIGVPIGCRCLALEWHALAGESGEVVRDPEPVREGVPG